MLPKDADGIANRADPDQTAKGAVWSGSALFTHLSVQKLRIFTVGLSTVSRSVDISSGKLQESSVNRDNMDSNYTRLSCFLLLQLNVMDFTFFKDLFDFIELGSEENPSTSVLQNLCVAFSSHICAPTHTPGVEERCSPTPQPKMCQSTTKPTKWPVCPAKIQISLGSAQTHQSLPCPHEEALGSWLPIHKAHSKDSNQPGHLPSDQSLR